VQEVKIAEVKPVLAPVVEVQKQPSVEPQRVEQITAFVERVVDTNKD
jgi:hypothetical protein